MSRLAKRPLILPSGVTAAIADNSVTLKGPRGELTTKLLPVAKVEQTADSLQVTVKNPANIKQRAVWGLSWALLRNMIIGVSQGYTKQLEINGVGFKAAMVQNQLELRVGFSYSVYFTPPPGVKIEVEKNIITITGIDKQLVGQVTADIRAIKKPEPYKGKGIKYVTEVIRRKAGKVAKAAA